MDLPFYSYQEIIMKYSVQYTLPYDHLVQVGIEAESQNAAIAEGQALFDQGEIWDDTAEVPLLVDDYVETSNVEVPLNFTIEGECESEWPMPDSSVIRMRQQNAAFRAALLLVEAYQRGEACGVLGSIDWSDLDEAYQMALKSL
jgi:hypothetical protein